MIFENARRAIVTAALLTLGLAFASEGVASGPDEFIRECAEKAEAAAKTKTIVVPGKEGWLFFSGDLRHVAAGQFWGTGEKEPLSAILEYRRELDNLGIELILLPVPAKASVYPDKIGHSVPMSGGKPARVDRLVQKFYGVLRENGVTVLDMTDPFIDARKDDSKLGPMYCRQDSHWSGRACQLTARAIASLVAKRPWARSARRTAVESVAQTIEIEGELWKHLPAPRPPREKIPVRRASLQGGGPVTPDPASPILLLGDSHTLVFSAGGDMMATGAGLLEQIAIETGIVPDVIGVRGSGATPARINLYRRVADNPAYLAGKKMVIWCFSARELTESGWRKVPVKK